MSAEIFLNALVAYFVIVDPVGASLVFNALAEGRRGGDCGKTALRATGLSFAIVAAFGLFGADLLARLGIAMESFRIAGGFLLFYTAFSMVVRPDSAPEGDQYKPSSDIAVFPMSIPMMAGPGCLTLTILLFSNAKNVERGTLSVILALAVVFLATLAALLMSGKIVRLVGETANAVMKRLLGVLLAALSVQFIADGVIGLVNEAMAV